jgi:acyl dehydratase
MPIDPAAVGLSGQPYEHAWTSKDTLLYAVGVGAGHPDPLAELAFTTENTRGVEQRVLPTFAVVLAFGGGSIMASAGSFDRTFLVHGEQGITLHQPIPAEGRAVMTSTITGVYDKGSGAVVTTETRAVDAVTGQPIVTNNSSAFIRGEGGFGGQRGPSGTRNVAPHRPADHVVSYTTKPDQALVYRLSGDRNPLHADPWYAARAGFARPILHGLCSYGFTGRALLHALCGSDPTRFRSMEGRFSRPVYPGDTLTVSMWVDGDEAVFRTEVDSTTVIDNGRCTFLI